MGDEVQFLPQDTALLRLAPDLRRLDRLVQFSGSLPVRSSRLVVEKLAGVTRRDRSSDCLTSGRTQPLEVHCGVWTSRVSEEIAEHANALAIPKPEYPRVVFNCPVFPFPLESSEVT